MSTWLYRIVVNARPMKIRKGKAHAKYLTQTGYDDGLVHDWPSAGSWNDPEGAALSSELRDVWTKVWAGFPRRYGLLSSCMMC